jgi:hypothetical protein
MRVLGISVTDAAGHFVFAEDKPDTGPHRLQAAYKGVNYNKLVTPNMGDFKRRARYLRGDQIDRRADCTADARARAVQEPDGRRETVLIQNNSNTTYNNPELGSLRFLPPTGSQ